VSTEGPLSVVFAGFRATGKTTFLVALWHTVVNSEVPGALSLETFYEGDRDYIIQRHNEWLAYEAVKRTVVDHDTPIRMTLREAQRGRLIHLGIPDLSGETFKVQFEERRASPILVDAIRGAAGVALFINPQNVQDPTRIRDIWDALDEREPPALEQSEDPPPQSLPAPDEPAVTQVAEVGEASDQGKPPNPEQGKKSAAAEFTASVCCTQVKYVDLLQQLFEHGPRRPLRCAVIVSAMDTLDGTEFQDRPEHFVRTRMSMLNQYLLANTALCDARVYGVSAQGGAYDNVTIETLAKLGTHRIRVCTEGRRDNDITRPLRWLAFGEE
jgi:double-GTPase-like protein